MQQHRQPSRPLHQSTGLPTLLNSVGGSASKKTNTLALDATAPRDTYPKQRSTMCEEAEAGSPVRPLSDAASRRDSSRQSGNSHYWKSPFAYVDPMSVDIDTASSLISRPDDSLVLRDTIIIPHSRDFEEDVSRPDIDATPSNSSVGDGGLEDLGSAPISNIEETIVQSRSDSVLRAHSILGSAQKQKQKSNTAGMVTSSDADDSSSCTRSCLTEETCGTSITSEAEEREPYTPARECNGTFVREGSATGHGLEDQSTSNAVTAFRADASLTEAPTSAVTDSTRDCDLLELLISRTAQKRIPKAAAMSRKGMTCFTCSDVFWLITTVRSCLKRLKFEWSEFFVAQSMGFRASYNFNSKDDRSAARHQFDILLFRLKFRPGYGADICSAGISNANFAQAGTCCEGLVHRNEVKRIRGLIRAYLDAALARREEAEIRGTIVPLSVNGAGPIGLRSTQSTGPKVASGSASLSSKTGSFAG